MKKIVLVVMMLIGLFWSNQNVSSTIITDEPEIQNLFSTGDSLVERAKQKIGCPYKWGATGPEKFDCSGFVQWVYGSMGISVNRTSRSQWLMGEPVDVCDLEAGDLVFFARGKHPSSIYHVGMVISSDGNGNYNFIHSGRGGVHISSGKNYQRKFFGAKRIV